jgi:hypothetical protein
VPPPRNTNILSGKWIFCHKLKPDSSLDRYKASWVLRGFSQEQGVDIDKMFSLIVKLATVRIILSIALSLKWGTRQLNIKNEPVCWLNHSLYGLKQASRAWYHCFTTFITSIDFTCSCSDMSLFILQCAEGTAFLLLNVNDIVLAASSTWLLDRITASLRSEFAMKGMGSAYYFLGVAITRDSSGMHLSQDKYAAEILDKASMTACKHATTPIDTSPKLAASAGPPVDDPTEYRSLTRALQYLTFTRPNIACAIQQVCLQMHNSRKQHLAAIKHTLRYVKATMSHGVQLRSSSPDSMVTYTDADWAGCPDTRYSTSSFCVYLSANLFS